ncbi:hypothetical protein FOZ62_020720 [Perkinsus olseni]|uniref:Uncharacterized protein n=1 Tax=Perkinsus olseni TaxID=32597 RepID=A0A7J6PC08_PEROL|nr:hypothetical protein FOZ62_020720 [Perkinsus olseni]
MANCSSFGACCNATKSDLNSARLCSTAIALGSVDSLIALRDACSTLRSICTQQYNLTLGDRSAASADSIGQIMALASDFLT